MIPEDKQRPDPEGLLCLPKEFDLHWVGKGVRYVEDMMFPLG